MPDQPFDAAEIKDMVRARYGGIAAGAAGNGCAPAAASCCGPAPAVEAKAREMGYSPDDLAAVPDGANLGLGCGNPPAIAALRPGEVVVDLGSGAGFDCLLAGRQVGPTGHVIGVDMTHEMLNKARGNAARAGAANVTFRLGEIEHLPIADNTADVILSNCVINLVPDKAQAFREAFRVLKPGGRLAISDVVNTRPLTADLAADRALVCGCVAGAAPVRDVEAWLHAAGFQDVCVTVKPESRGLVASWAPGRGTEDYVASAIIEARKPGGAGRDVSRPGEARHAAEAAGEVCPAWPGHPVTARWGSPDPAAVADDGAGARMLARRDAVRMLAHRIKLFLALPLRSLGRLALQRQVDAIGRLRPDPAEAQAS